MSFWRKLRASLPWHRAAQERDMQEELDSLKRIAGKNELGNLTRVAEDARTIWRWNWLDTLWQDVRYSIRTLRKSPGFVVTAVGLLSVGIGLNLAFFQFANALFLKPVVIRDPASLVHVSVPAGEDRLDYAAMQFLQANNTVFSAVLMDLKVAAQGRLEWGDKPLTPGAAFVSPNWFDELGVTALRGRLFATASEGAQSAPAVAVISERFWTNRLHSDPDVVGSKVRLTESGIAFTIIGIVPAAPGSVLPSSRHIHAHLNPPDLWIPAAQISYLFPRLRPGEPGAVGGRLFARLKPGVSRSGAVEGLHPLLDELARRQPYYRGNNSVTLLSGSSNFRSTSDTSLLWLSIALASDRALFAPEASILSATLLVLLATIGLSCVIPTLRMLRGACKRPYDLVRTA